MSLNDPFFDAWVRDKLQHAEARPPEHLWDAILKGSHYYIIADRNRYFLVLLLLFLVTGGIAYWAFHPNPPATASASLNRSRHTMPGPAAPADIQPPASAHGTPDPARDANAHSVASTIALYGVRPGVPPGSAENIMPTTASEAAAAPTIPAVPGFPLTPESALASAASEASLAPIPKDADLAIPFRTGGAPENALAGAMIPNAMMPGTTNTTTAGAIANPAAATTTAPTILLRERRHTYLEVYAGPDHNTHYITASSPAYKPYVQQVKGMEIGYPSFSLGLRLDMPLWTDSWRLRLGVHYAQINEQLHYFNPSVVKTVSQVTMRSVVQPSGAVVQVADTTSVSYKGQYVKQSLNAYRQIDLPVLVSYTFLHARQFQMAGSAGAFFNISSWYNGDILDTTYLPTALHGGTDHAASTWKNHLGASLYGSLSLRNQLTSRIQVSLEPYLRYELSTVNRDVQVYKERFVTSGIAIGLEFALGR